MFWLNLAAYLAALVAVALVLRVAYYLRRRWMDREPPPSPWQHMYPPCAYFPPLPGNEFPREECASYRTCPRFPCRWLK